jgi:polysaccharide export outer membrane protein
MITAVLLTMLLLLGCPASRAESGPPTPADKTLPPAATPPDANAKVSETTYQIGVNDVLHISVWKEPELTATLQVRTDGMISIPLVNDVRAAGLTPMGLAASITEKLRTYLDDPRVTVVVSSMKSQRIYLTGEVLHNGPIALTPNMTVLQALATSGLSTFANTKKIYVLRSVNGVPQKLPVNYKRLIKGRNVDQNILLQPEDMIVVP